MTNFVLLILIVFLIVALFGGFYLTKILFILALVLLILILWSMLQRDRRLP